MRKLLLISIIMTSFISSGIYASPELVQKSSGLENLEIKSSDEARFDPLVEAEKIEEVISNKVELAFLSNLWSYREPIISGINDEETNVNESRTCAYCIFFILLYALILIAYGEWLWTHPEAKRWFFHPLFLGVFIYVVHAWFHIKTASPIFLDYYWIWLMDELLFSSFIYWIFIVNHRKKYLLSLTVKQKKQRKI